MTSEQFIKMATANRISLTESLDKVNEVGGSGNFTICFQLRFCLTADPPNSAFLSRTVIRQFGLLGNGSNA